MAGYQAIAAVGETIISVLRDAKDAQGDGFVAGASVEAFRKPLPSPRPLLALHLYRVAHATRVRQQDRVVRPGVARPAHTVDLHFLLMVWAAHPRDAHVLLGWAVQTLALNMSLPAALLNREFPGAFFDDEAVEVVPDNMSLQDLTNVWEVQKPDIQPAAGYVVRGLTLHSTHGAAGPPVQTRELEHRSTGGGR